VNEQLPKDTLSTEETAFDRWFDEWRANDFRQKYEPMGERFEDHAGWALGFRRVMLISWLARAEVKS
jgi:hypothetical protein